jgi:hypothetical protein
MECTLSKIKNRLADVVGEARYELVGGDRYAEEYTRLTSLFPVPGAPVRGPDPVIEEDLSDKPTAAIVERLRSLPVPKDAVVTVLWPYDRVGAKLELQRVIDALDGLWYPGADDVWITDSSHTWLILIDHEEHLAFYDRGSELS